MLTSTNTEPIVFKDLKKPLTFIFISSCCEYWGGSEELWSESARYLQKQGYTVHAFKNRVQRVQRIQELKADGIAVKNIAILFTLLYRFSFAIKLLSFLKKIQIFKYKNERHQLNILQPSLVIISQGDNYDGVEMAKVCLELNLPYIIISQKASDAVWPNSKKRQIMQDVYKKAKSSFFVSQHNLALTEAQLGYSLTNATVVRNPHRALIPAALPYPPTKNDCFQIACVARLWILDKGQDILLRVLAQDKWRNRNLHISFFGKGIDRDGLIDLSKLLELKNVSFPGFVNNIMDIWHHHQALIMPSRAEGLPIALVEAMMCGRPGIVTDVGGISEIVEDDITGFIATSPCFAEIDKVLERAWQRRYEWENIGKEASISIRKLIPPHPEQVFSDHLLQLCQS
ncbi:group 1 glycosyl transferase [Calothrix brevissima NIES-22]|nr:group 1 glycosyl transferase [Calothrix brevissima NIES-22]